MDPDFRQDDEKSANEFWFNTLATIRTAGFPLLVSETAHAPGHIVRPDSL